MLIEGPRFRLWFSPDISPDEFNAAAGAICRVLVAGPPEPPGHRRRVAVRTAMAQYQGSLSGRAKQLEDRYRAYLSSGWLREQAFEVLPEPRSDVERVCLHKLARVCEGRSLCWHSLFDIATRLVE